MRTPLSPRSWKRETGRRKRAPGGLDFAGESRPTGVLRLGWIRTWISRTPFTQRLVRACVNLVGAASATVFSYSFLHFYLETHRPIGIIFFAQQTLVVLAYLIRRPARVFTQRPVDWILAFAGTSSGSSFGRKTASCLGESGAVPFSSSPVLP